MASRVRIILDDGGTKYNSPRRALQRLQVYAEAYHLAEPPVALGVPSWQKLMAFFRVLKQLPPGRFPATLWICREKRGIRARQSEYIRTTHPAKKRGVWLAAPVAYRVRQPAQRIPLDPQVENAAQGVLGAPRDLEDFFQAVPAMNRGER